MKQTLKKGLAVLFVVAMTLGLTACSTKFDASAFVKAELDLFTKHDVEQYVDIVGVKEETAESIYTEAIESMDIAETMLADATLSQELVDKYEQWFLDVLANTKYTVLEAEETEEGFTVNVEIEPLKAFDGMADEVETQTTAYLEEVYQDILAGGETPSDEELTEAIYTIMIDIMNQILENPTYSEKVVVETKIIKNSNGGYDFDDASFEEVGEKLIDVSGLE